MGASGTGSGVCRLCGSVGEPLHSLLGDALLGSLVSKYIGISIHPNDTFSTESCIDCVDKLKMFHEYAQNCIKFQNRLMELSTLNNPEPTNNIKIELEYPEIELLKKESLDTNDSDRIAVKEEYLSDPASNDGGGFDYDSNSDTPLMKIKSKKKTKLKKSRLLSKESSSQKYTSKYPNLQKYIKFKCHVCNEISSNWFRLKSHLLQVHQEPAKVFCVCGYVAKSKTAIYRHVAGHNNPTSVNCEVCRRILKNEAAREKHMERHYAKSKDHKETTMFQCLNCPKVCKTKESLKSHERVHFPMPERYKYPCGICKNRFTTKSSVLGHIRAVHEKLKRFVCDVCGYACSTNGELRQHRAIHSDEKSYECKICSKRFKTCSGLNSHVDTHAETSYPCGVCGKVLNSRRTLRKHFLVHEDLCKHVCTYCDRAFKRRQTLKVHLTIHTGDKPIQCRWCPSKFAYSSVYRTHKNKVHYDKIAPNEINTISESNTPLEVIHKTENIPNVQTM